MHISKTPKDIMKKPLHKQSVSSGFTLLEVMVTITVAAILVGLALPNFTELIKNNRLLTKSNEMVIAINTARQYAISRSLPVLVCHSANANSASSSCGGSGSNWNTGYLIYSVKPYTALPTALRAYISSDELLSKVDLKGDDNVTVTPAVATDYIAFAGNGLLFLSANITIDICDDRTQELGNRITVSTAGRTSTQELQCA